ncbi:GCC2 and GCC3 domain-containing protein, partial [Cardiosporidium cionae]
VERSECTACTDGFYCREGSTYATFCKLGHFCEYSSRAINEKYVEFPASPGFKADFLSSNLSVSVACPVGSFCPIGTDIEWLCPPGTKYSSAMSHPNKCVPCTAGASCPSFGLSNESPCEEGYFCPKNSRWSKEFPCHSGTYAISTALQSSNECMLCPAGNQCDIAAIKAGAQPFPCLRGHFCSAGTSLETAEQCPSGRYLGLATGSSISDCIACANGKYCVYSSSVAPRNCSSHAECPEETTFPLNCVAGYAFDIKPFLGSCQRCRVGTLCPGATRRKINCPSGTFSGKETSQYVNPLTHPLLPECLSCPKNTLCKETSPAPTNCSYYSSIRGISQCEDCPTGYRCRSTHFPEKAKWLLPCTVAGNCQLFSDYIHRHDRETICPYGYHCKVLESVNTLRRCTSGTHRSSKDGIFQNTCVSSPEGTYSALNGRESYTGLCAIGHYCPENSTSSMEYLCPQGTLRLREGAAAAGDCSTCPAGSYCPNAVIGTNLIITSLPCPEGFYCPNDDPTVLFRPCPLGTYRDLNGGKRVSDCFSCPAGVFCGAEGLISPSGVCSPGYVCLGGAAVSKPEDGIAGFKCTESALCPPGSKIPLNTITLACPPGHYLDSQSASNFCPVCPLGWTCDESRISLCPEGYFCAGASSITNISRSPSGSFAPAGASQAFPCPVGTYQRLAGKALCDLCPAGYICPAKGLIMPIPCPVGRFCPSEGSTRSLHCPAGSYNPFLSGLSCLRCPPGFYCETAGLHAPSGPCNAGFFCASGAYSSSPRPLSLTDTFGSCPAGHYCPEGTEWPIPCPLGTFSNTISAISASTCSLCTFGMFCNTTGLTKPSGMCSEGFFCPNGSVSPMPHGSICTAGSFCPEGSSSMTSCPKGTVSDRKGMAICKACLPGFECESNSTGTSSLPCPIGSFCLDGKSIQCPLGSFRSKIGGLNEDHCELCPRGKYCGSSEGLSSPDGFCDSGYYCFRGATVSTPNEGKEGGRKCVVVDTPTGNCSAGYVCPTGSLRADERLNRCPAGHFCPSSAIAPTHCPVGSILTGTGSTAAANCTNCPSGMYCQSIGATSPTGMCHEGYFCKEGTIVPNPAAALCPAGSSCPLGSSASIPCETGTYQPLVGMATCNQCDDGFECTALRRTVSPSGAFSLAGVVTQCGIGTYNPFAGSRNISSCLPCPPGKYCDSAGSIAPTGVCDAGYYCGEGAQLPRPVSLSETNNECPKGYFCPSGSKSPLPCHSGKICSRNRLSEPDAICPSGYFCKTAAHLKHVIVSFPVSILERLDGLCPKGFYCEEGTDDPSPCPFGTYGGNTGASSVANCTVCPSTMFCGSLGLSEPSGVCTEGYFCREGSKQSNERICPLGHFCRKGTIDPFPCREGTYAPHAGHAACQICPDGKWCEEGAIHPILCPLGFYCAQGHKFQCPNTTLGEMEGLSSAEECSYCPIGKFCERQIIDPSLSTGTLLCTSGYYCSLSSLTVTDPSAGDIVVPLASNLSYSMVTCPFGSYCPEGSSFPERCANGMAVFRQGAASSTSCVNCLRGNSCNSAISVCEEGFLCTGGAATTRPTRVGGTLCSTGKYCSKGATKMWDCPVGTVGETEGLTVCTPCYAGYHCPFIGMTSIVGFECSAGKYCPSGVGVEFYCPIGTFNPGTHRKDCIRCPTGYVCNRSGLQKLTTPCPAGYFCTTSLNGDGSYINSIDRCPAGFVCPEKTASPLPCHEGFYFDMTYRNCSACPVSRACDRIAIASRFNTTPCSAGFFCSGGSRINKPILSPGGKLCGEGKYCPLGSTTEHACPAGTYGNEQGLSVCKISPAGFYSEAASILPLPCPSPMFCPAHSATPQRCPDGTYSNATELASKMQCAFCPAGRYCINGEITGPCRAGSLCLIGSSVEEISASEKSGSLSDILDIRMIPIIRCPVGAYCPEGVETAIPCPPGTHGKIVGATVISDCFVCPIGSFCPGAAAPPIVCPIGSYCSEGTAAAIPCPPGTIGSTLNAGSIDNCKPCSIVAVNHIKWWLDPSALQCVENNATVTFSGRCPGGTYPIFEDPEILYNCISCPAGFYCQPDVLTPLPCPAGSYCPARSPKPIRCPPRTFCLNRSDPPVPCPAGSICLGGDTSLIPCPTNRICLRGIILPTGCPRGSFFLPKRCTHRNIAECCSLCPPGSYSDREGATHCQLCSAGYFCIGGSISAKPNTLAEGGGPCLPGNFCVEGSRSPSVCPVGTFSINERGTSLASCLPCPEDTFQNKEGQNSCIPCGNSASTLRHVGARTCICNSHGESYQIERRLVGFITSPWEDYPSPLSTSRRCGSQQVRNARGDCISQRNCTLACGGKSGSLLSLQGICQCDQALQIEERCDSHCRSLVRAVQLNDKQLQFYDPFERRVLTASIPQEGWFREVVPSCADTRKEMETKTTTHCSIAFQRTSRKGISALYFPPAALFSEKNSIRDDASRFLKSSFFSSDLSREADDVLYVNKNVNSSPLRHLQSFINISVSITISHSIICVPLGTTVVWEIQDGIFPIYDSVSLLNTNTEFDYSRFTDLRESILSGKVPAFFSHTFSTKGVYVFNTEISPEQESIIAVVSADIRCPFAAKYVGEG